MCFGFSLPTSTRIKSNKIKGKKKKEKEIFENQKDNKQIGQLTCNMKSTTIFRIFMKECNGQHIWSSCTHTSSLPPQKENERVGIKLRPLIKRRVRQISSRSLLDFPHRLHRRQQFPLCAVSILKGYPFDQRAVSSIRRSQQGGPHSWR